MPGVGLVAIAVMAIVLLAAKPVHEPPPETQLVTAEATTDEVPRVADGPRADVVPAPRRGETRIRPPVTRPAHPRGAGLSRPRASGQPPSASRGPSQSP
jgi:hypothetical protein